MDPLGDVSQAGRPAVPPATPPGGWWGQDAGAQGGMLRFLAILATHWRLAIAVPIGLVIATVVLALLLPLRYTSTTTFVPERNATAIPGAIAGLASQFGVRLDAGGGESESPYFYASVVESRAVLGGVLESKIPVPATEGSADSSSVLDVLRVKGRDANDRFEKAIKRLRRIVTVNVDRRTDIVGVAVRWRNAAVAAALAECILTQINRFNAEQRQSTARQERVFLEDRLVSALSDLRASEDSLSDFLERNRRFRESPSLVFVQQRYQRQVDLKARVYESLQQQYERVRLREVNNTPVITVIEPPNVPARHSWPRRRRMVVIAGLLGVVLGVISALTADHLQRARDERNPDLLTLDTAWSRLRKRVTAFKS